MSLKTFINNKMVSKSTTHKIRRFYKKLRLTKFEDDHVLVCVGFGYGKKINNFGKLVEFNNEGTYSNAKDLWLAIKAFREEI